VPSECEAGEGKESYKESYKETLSPPLRGDPLPQAGEGKEGESSAPYSAAFGVAVAAAALAAASAVAFFSTYRTDQIDPS
jgi:hypothetical protein